MEASVDYDTPEKQPDIGKCLLVIQSTDFYSLTVTGVCIQQDAAGATSGQPIPFITSPDMAAMAAFLQAVGDALVTDGVLPAGKVIVK